MPSVQNWKSSTMSARATSMPYWRTLPLSARASTPPTDGLGPPRGAFGDESGMISVWAMPHTCSLLDAALMVMSRMRDSWVASARATSPVIRPSAMV